MGKVHEARNEAKNRVKEAELKFRKANAEKDAVIQKKIKEEVDKKQQAIRDKQEAEFKADQDALAVKKNKGDAAADVAAVRI